MSSSRTAPPRLVILAGPNGAGKSTCAAEILRGPLAVDEFVNADVIAKVPPPLVHPPSTTARETT